MPPSDLLQHIADSIGPIRERIGRLEADVAYLRRRISKKTKAPTVYQYLQELRPWWPYLALLALIAFGHMTVDEFGQALKAALLKWLTI